MAGVPSKTRDRIRVGDAKRGMTHSPYPLLLPIFAKLPRVTVSNKG